MIEKIADLIDLYDYESKEDFDTRFYNYETIDSLHDELWDYIRIIHEIKEIIYEK